MEGELGDGGGVPPDVAQELNGEGHEDQQVAEEEAEQEAPDYAMPELVRPLANWEISRDHLVFADMCGLDTGKRHVLHVLEPRLEGEHGGVLLTAAGNTVQLLTMMPQVAPSGSSVQSRRYLFGFSGSGIGSLAVHPSGKFFAVAEKGVKPNISIYRYPQITVSQVLRNGTERAYASVEFSQDGETLASVGSAPDFLLTVWNWREEQTVLRCKAFGQDVFSVRFAPTDSGFLATSGVGHIRLWKMAATFTGLKLQGDIGKFGKSELSDIEAFCVLPDKKVLSGTERGVLLLWDGNFIKCEILTSRRHLPHAGTINVVDFDEDERLFVTAGKDGFVRFWSFDSIDSADVATDETVALVPMRRQVLIKPQMDIRAVVKEDAGRYLLQDGVGGVHLLVLKSNDEHQVEFDYVPNDTGRATGIACSPYEHIAATCGEDGSVRAWDYVAGACLMTVFPEQSFTDDKDNNHSDRASLAPASTITWTPTSAAVTNDTIPQSRQVAVGFDDGLVRVMLMDIDHRAWVRINIFKPHSKRVTCMAYSHSGSAFVTASADGTFFLFQVVPSIKSSKFAKYPCEYEPYGFQRVPAAVIAVCWRDDDEALLVTLANGQVLEFFLPSGELYARPTGDKEDTDSFETAHESDEPALISGTKSAERESYELHLSSREWALHQRNRFMNVKELDTLEAQYPSINAPQVEDKIRNQFQVEIKPGNPGSKALAALYTVMPKKDKGKPLSRANKDRIYLSCQAPLDGTLFVAQHDLPTPFQELASESGGNITSLELSTSENFLLCGMSNGKFQIRSARRPHAFLSGEFHDYAASSTDGRLHLALSFDDSYAITVGSDGNLSICRVYSEKVEEAAAVLSGKFESMIAEATIARDQAFEKQEAVVTMQQKAMSDDKSDDDPSNSGGGASNTDLSALPAFHGAKAYAAYIENKLSPSVAAAKDNEEFQGVIRFVSDAKSTEGLPSVTPRHGDSAGKTGVPAAALIQLGVADLANPREAYTIEDAKLKSEADARARSTLSKQDSTRAVLSKMRKQLQELQAQDSALPPQSRVDPEEWEIDLDYGDLLMRQGDEACDEVRKELAFAVEKEELLLLKMRETYVGPLAVELLTLHAFESGLSVQSFRTMKMPVTLQKRLAELHTAEAAKKQSSVGLKPVGSTRRPSVLDIMEKDTPLDDTFPLKEDERRMIMSYHEPAVDGGHGGAGWSPAAQESGGSKSVHGFEARKRLRTERKERLARWQSNKPGEDADDPRDVVAIAFAQRNMGDYKLKTAADYVVPEHQRVNAVKKLRQMALLEESLYSARLRFNAKVLELRELKVQLINELRHDQERLLKLRATLAAGDDGGSAQPPPLPSGLSIDLREWPEQRERVSDADVELFLREKKVISHSQTPSTDANESMARPNGAEKHHQTSDRSIAAVARALEGPNSTVTAGNEGLTGLTVGHLHVQIEDGVAMASAATVSAPATGSQTLGSNGGNFDEDDVSVREYLMRQEALLLERKQRREIVAFDAAVAHLRREKLALEVGFKQAELRLFTLFSELSLLESFESKENLLSSKLEKSKNEKAQIVAELRDVQELLASKKRELDEWSRQERAVQGEFLTLVNGGIGSSATPHPSFAALQKLFKRKIKRAKKKPTASGKDDGKDGNGQSPESARDGEEQEEDEEEEEDEDEDYDEDDDDDDEEEEDTCPAGCDLTLYEKVLALREKRADVDDAVGELNKAIEELRKAGERQAAKQRAIDKELAATEQDTQQFQSEKQSRFNQLDVVVALSTRQLRCLEPPSPNQQNWLLPAQAAGCLVFTTQAFAALTERIESLQAENKQLRQQFRDLHKQQSVLAREKRQQQETIARSQERSEQLQRLKFGQLVDLEVLDRACDASAVDELQARVKLREVEGERTLRRVKQTHPQLQHAILQATEQNTALLAQIAALTERQAELERELNRNQGSGSGSGGDGGGLLSTEDDAALAEREMKERNKLVRLVKLQAREVEALKQEIGLLRGKDGKVYAPRV